MAQARPPLAPAPAQALPWPRPHAGSAPGRSGERQPGAAAGRSGGGPAGGSRSSGSGCRPRTRPAGPWRCACRRG
jgi:hypothetical protein